MNTVRLRAIIARLRAAIRHRSLLGVMLMFASVVRRAGLGTVIRLALGGKPLPHRLVQEEQRRRQELAADGSDLDLDFTLGAGRWARWSKIIGLQPPALDPREDQIAPVRVSFVVCRGPGDAAATRAAIGGLGDSVDILAVGAVAPADGRFIVFVEAGDIPLKALPLELARAARGGVCEVVSFDMIRRVGDRVQPLFLPGANLTLLRSTDYLFSRVAVTGAALPAGAADAADPRALVLGWAEGRQATQVRGRWRHVARPILEAAIGDDAIPARRASAAASPPSRTTSGEGVSVVICSKDKGRLLQQLVRHLLSKGRALVEEVVIVANGATNAFALQAQAELALSPRVRLLRDNGPFNFSRLTNVGVQAARGRGPLLLLNDDIVPQSEDWLERLLAHLDRPETGCVGPLLLYPDETVQHAGIYMGRDGPKHTLRGARLPDHDYLFMASAAREASALTGAVLLTPRDLYEALNGLDEQLALHMQDIDYCLRAKAAGYINVFEPASVLFHIESLSVQSISHDSLFGRRRHVEHYRFTERWRGLAVSDALHPAGFDGDRFRMLAGPAGQRPPGRGE